MAPEEFTVGFDYDNVGPLDPRPWLFDDHRLGRLGSRGYVLNWVSICGSARSVFKKSLAGPTWLEMSSNNSNVKLSGSLTEKAV
jgi:hypothetical protein